MINTSSQPAQLLRVRGRHRETAAILAQTTVQARLPPHTQLLPSPPDLDDSIQIDMSLHVTGQDNGFSDPVPGTAYVGLTPAQRGAFLDWAHEPMLDAPLAFQSLYVAHLEIDLFDEPTLSDLAHQKLLELSNHAQWQANPALARALLLSFWLRQSGVGLADWLAETPAPASCIETALGLQALLEEGLRWPHVRKALAAWIQPAPEMADDTLRLRLSSLTASLNQEPLQHALSQIEEEKRQPAHWRCQHRQIRILIPQPAIRRPLEHLLYDMISITESSPAHDTGPQPRTAPLQRKPTGSQAEALPQDEWQLILEFGQSRSDYFDLVLRECQRVPRFVQIMDEDRNMVYRITFAKRDMRRFWRIWDYVQNWSTTRAYLNSKELEKWKIWPYSQYLR